jgi:hypothetical protein
MLLNFTTDFLSTINQGRALVADIQISLAKNEPYIGNSKTLDKLYAQSILISGIIDYLSNSDNADPREDEGLLMCLRAAINKNLCKRPRKGIVDWANYHKLPVGQNPIPTLPTIPTITPVTPVVPTIPVTNNPTNDPVTPIPTIDPTPEDPETTDTTEEEEGTTTSTTTETNVANWDYFYNRS